MKKLWAPWRLQYIKMADQINHEGCIFCDFPAAGTEQDRQNLILYRSELCFVILNKYPYNNGHLMVVPYRHTGTLEKLSAAERLELMTLLQRSTQVLQQAFSPHGFNIGMNLGRVAGAGIDEHLHFHIVPRWNGDTNFMLVLGDVKVISAGLDETWEQLAPLFGEISGKSVQC